jgi:hypothetical protein
LTTSAPIGEEIDIDRDRPEELERKAHKRQKTVIKIRLPKHRNPARRSAVEDPMQPADSRAEAIGRDVEDLWKAFDAIEGELVPLRSMTPACTSAWTR